LLSKSKMESLTTRLLEVKSLGLELPMQRKSTSGIEMNKEQFMETGWIGQNSSRRNQNSLIDQKPFLHPHFVKTFQKLLESKTEHREK